MTAIDEILKDHIGYNNDGSLVTDTEDIRKQLYEAVIAEIGEDIDLKDHGGSIIAAHAVNLRNATLRQRYAKLFGVENKK